MGKTCLFSRLQGHKFKEEYLPTDEIQVSRISATLASWGTVVQWLEHRTDDSGLRVSGFESRWHIFRTFAILFTPLCQSLG